MRTRKCQKKNTKKGGCTTCLWFPFQSWNYVLEMTHLPVHVRYCEVMGPFALESNRNTIDHNGSQIKQLIMLLEPLNKFTSYHNFTVAPFQHSRNTGNNACQGFAVMCQVGAILGATKLPFWRWPEFGRPIRSPNSSAGHHLPATHADRCEVPMWNSGLPCRDAEVLHSNCTHTENETASLFKGCSQYLSVQTIEKLLKRVGSMALETRASFIRTTVRKTEFEAPPSRSAAASSKAFSRSGWSSKDLGKTMQAACQILSNAATSSDDCNCLSETGNMGSPWLGRTWWTKSMCSAKPASWLKRLILPKNEQIYLNSVQRLKTAETPQRSMEKYAVRTWCAKNQTQICPDSRAYTS